MTNLDRKFREKHGKEDPGIIPTDRANALYYYKQGLKYGDLTAAEKYLRQYYAFGGGDKDVAKSVERAHPLGGLAHKDWRAFVATLSPSEMEKFKFALKWYNQTYKGMASAEVRKAAHMPLNFNKPDQEQPEMPAKLTIQEALKMMK